MTSRRRPVFRHVCIVSLIIVAGCRRIEGESRPDQTASRSAAAQPQPSTELAKRVAQAFATRTIFPSSAIAQYLLSNRAHRALVIECMDAAGYGKYGYDTSDPPITPAMLDGHRLAFSWISPPAGFIELPTISKGSQVTPPTHRPGNLLSSRPRRSKSGTTRFRPAVSRIQNFRRLSIGRR